MRRVERWIFAAESAQRLAAVRIGLCTLLAVRLAMHDYDVAAARHAHFLPHFYMDVFSRMPTPELASVLQVCGIGAALAAAAGLWLRITLPSAFACALILDGILNSGGRVMVRDAVLMLCIAVLIAAGRAAHARRGSVGERYGWPIRTMMVVVVLAYFFAALQKWRYSGFAWVTSDNLRWILYAQPHPSGFALFVADRPLLAHLFAGGALFLETLFPLVLFVPRLRWLFIPSAIAMHVAIRLALGLDYSSQWLAMVIVFVNWPVVIEAVQRPFAPAVAQEAAG